MRVVVQNTLTNRQWVAFDAPAGFTVGRDASCDVKLDSRFVSGTHIRIERADVQGRPGWEVEALPNVSPVEINGAELRPGQRVQFREQALIKIMEFVLSLEGDQQASVPACADGEQ